MRLNEEMSRKESVSRVGIIFYFEDFAEEPAAKALIPEIFAIQVHR